MKDMKALEFEDLVCSFIKKSGGELKRQFRVPDRGDARSGRIDALWLVDGRTIGIEIDGRIARKKSIFKLSNLKADEAFIILRSPVSIIKVPCMNSTI